MKKMIALLCGGKSGEHEISLMSAKTILQKIDYSAYDVTPIYIDKKGNWHVQKQITSNPQESINFTELNNHSIQVFHLAKMADVVIPVLHGPNGEDGKLQGMLEMANIPYVGCGTTSSAVCMDKIFTKAILNSRGVPQGEYYSVKLNNFNEINDRLVLQIESFTNYPCYIKPSNMGSSVGISRVTNTNELITGLKEAYKFDSRILIENEIVGRELEIGVIGNESLEISSIGEISNVESFYDYEQKYQDNSAIELTIPAHLDSRLEAKIKKIAQQTYEALDCVGLARIDMFYNEKSSQIFVNEVNTFPGFTDKSMFPLLFEHSGMTTKRLINKLIELAFENFENKNRFY